jgi:hypothetical protein
MVEMPVTETERSIPQWPGGPAHLHSEEPSARTPALAPHWLRGVGVARLVTPPPPCWGVWGAPGRGLGGGMWLLV